MIIGAILENDDWGETVPVCLVINIHGIRYLTIFPPYWSKYDKMTILDRVASSYNDL